ncbi:MAG: hypothetical protein JWM02_1286 [Frankiales bacterium]|nr:hypothetical protein [Frankiales bacterium]
MNLSLEDEIVLLRAQMDYLLERFADNPALGERPVNWAALDLNHAAERWSILTDWVDWLRDRYQLRETLPACWYAHPPQLEELSALRSSWVGAYLDPEAHAGDGSAWHDLLDRTLQRLREWDRTGCADGVHRPDVALPDDTDHSHRERTIHADLARRDQTVCGEG